MKRTKIFLLLGMLLSVFAGCIKETPWTETPGDTLPFPEGERAVLRMSVELPGIDTKTMADTPQIQNLRVVIFGSSGFLKESLDAEDLQAANTNGSSTLYTFTVKPSLTDSKNLRVHIIANCSTLFPWKYEDVVMSGSAYTTSGQDAYWCRFILPNGITPRKEYNYETESMEYVKNGNYYTVTEDVENAFKNLPLIRNFAKFTVESTTPQLVLNSSTTMALVNVPDRGSVAPYDPTRSLFMDHYKDSSYVQLKAHYPGFTPAGMQFEDTDPGAVTFHSGTTGTYMFERPKPGSGSDTPTYLIVHGIYYPLQPGKTASDLAAAVAAGTQAALNNVVDYNSGVDGYYKIDLMDEDGYYAVLRNFRYHIRISSVSKAGAATPAQAGSTGGTGDISSSTEAAALTDISDGYGRIAVSFVEMTLVEQQLKVELKYKFIQDIDHDGDTPNNVLSSEDSNGPVTITLGEKTGPVTVFSPTFSDAVANEAGTEVGDDATGRVKVLEKNDGEGYRTIHFTTNAPSPTGKAVQTLRITGKIDEFKSIYRDITFNLMEKQNMTVECVADEPEVNKPLNAVEDIKGKGVNVNISIPILLPESMFPLVFNIESSELTITPNTYKYPTENLPVQGGASIWKSGKQAFFYKKTLSYNEYKLLATNENGTKAFTCHFRTNTAQSASTVYVSNEYFNMGSGAFINYTMYNFNTVRFSNPGAAAGTNFNCTFNLDSRDSDVTRTITVILDGLVPQNPNDGRWTTLDAAAGEYSYRCSSTAVTLPVKTLTGNNYDGTYSVTLVSDDYHEKVRRTEDYAVNYTTETESLNITSIITNTGSNRSGTLTTDDGTVITLTFSNVRNLNAPTWGTHYLALADNSTFTISATLPLKQIDLTFAQVNVGGVLGIGDRTYQSGGAVSASGYTRASNNASGTWTGNASSVNFSVGDPDGGGVSGRILGIRYTDNFYTRLSGITVTYDLPHYTLVND